MNPGTPNEHAAHPKAIYPLAHGDLVSIRTSGSGGYGDPLERDPALVAQDVVLGHVSAARARERYAVVVDRAGTIDQEATDALRRERRAASGTSGGGHR